MTRGSITPAEWRILKRAVANGIAPLADGVQDDAPSVTGGLPPETVALAHAIEEATKGSDSAATSSERAVIGSRVGGSPERPGFKRN
jgi:hypothetical protein